MTRRADAETEMLLATLCRDASATLIPAEDGNYAFSAATMKQPRPAPGKRVRAMLAAGLLQETERGLITTRAAIAWLKRRHGGDLPFRAQHDEIAKIQVRESGHGEALANLDESPMAALARRAGRSGEPWLPPHAAAAAERLRRDFEVGQLQPRVTANWSASVSASRRSGDNSGIADLTDMALGARLRFDRAVQAVGPELSGVLVDVCCFLKGLETVERERQWPARSAKLVLKLALERLARHYGLLSCAKGKPTSGGVRHWGSGDYRPVVT